MPGLAVVLVGEDPASQVYVRNKGTQTVEVGMASFEHKLPADTCEADLLALIARLNADPAVHGILVQLPLPEHLDSDLVINAHRPGQGCGRVPHLERRAAGHRAEGDGALHAAGLPDDAARSSRLAVGDERRGGGAQQHRGQADGAAAAGRQLHGDDRAFADQGSGGGVPGGGYPGGGGGAARDDHGRHGASPGRR